MTGRRGWTLAVVALLLSSGCLGALTGGPITVSAEPAGTSQAVATDAGYERNGTTSVWVNRTLSVGDVSQEVAVENRVTRYEKALELGPLSAKLGVFAVVSSPAVEVGGESLNPVGDFSNDRLVRLAGGRYGGLGDVERLDSRTVRTLGTDTNVTRYAAVATVAGQEVDVYVHVTSVRHEGDYVIAIGVYPQLLEGEGENVLAMIRALEHPL